MLLLTSVINYCFLHLFLLFYYWILVLLKVSNVSNFSKIVQFFTEILRYNDFQDGGRPPFWISCDVIILPMSREFHDLNLVLNFHVDWFCSF